MSYTHVWRGLKNQNAYFLKNVTFHTIAKRILHYKIRAACVFLVLRFCSITKRILPWKMATAGENVAVSYHCKVDVNLQNERRRRKKLQFQSATIRILPYKMSAAGEIFAVSERY